MRLLGILADGAEIHKVPAGSAWRSIGEASPPNTRGSRPIQDRAMRERVDALPPSARLSSLRPFYAPSYPKRSPPRTQAAMRARLRLHRARSSPRVAYDIC